MRLKYNKACASILGNIKVLYTFALLLLFVLSLIWQQSEQHTTAHCRVTLPGEYLKSPLCGNTTLPSAQGFVLTVLPITSLTRLTSAGGPSSSQVRVIWDS